MQTSLSIRMAKFSPIICLVTSLLLWPVPVFAQAKEAAKSDAKPAIEKAIPLAVLCVAGVERWLSNADYLFEAVKREELSDFVGGQMSKLNDLKGIDKDKPFGMLVFLRPGLIPQPYPVSFVPVKNLSDLIGTASNGPFKVKKIDDTHYDLVTDNNTIHALLVGDYAWIASESDQLDFEFPDPVSFTKRLTTRYDLSFEFNLTSVPEGMKNIFLDFLRASTETSMQQRDGEPDAGHQLRRLNAMNSLDFLEQLVLQGERLTFGLSVDPKTKHASIEVDVQAKPDSGLSQLLQDVSARTSYFSTILREDTPLTFSMSWMMPPSNQKRLADFFETAEQEVASQLANAISGKKVDEKPNAASATPEAPKVASTGKPKRGGTGKPKKPKIPVPQPIKEVFDSLRATALTGHIDFFAQFVTDSKSNGSPQFTLLGGAKIADGAKLASGLTEILKQIKDRPGLAALDFNIDTHKGVTFHRLLGSEIRRSDELMYGGKPALYIGLGSQVVWFAIGQPDALTQIKQVIDRVEAAPSARPSGADRIPFQLTMHMKRWIEFGQANGEELQKEGFKQREKAIAAQQAAATANGAKPVTAEEPKVVAPANSSQPRNGDNTAADRGNRQTPIRAWQEMQRKAFSGSDDLLRVDFRPTDQGARLKFEFDEGFIRLMGFGVSAGMDSLAEREQRQRKPNTEAPKK